MIKRTIKRVLRQTYRMRVGYIHKRWELPHILNARGLVGEGVEIGVQHGDFSELILDGWKGRKLYSIDPWREFPSTDYRDVANVTQAEHDQFYRDTCAKLARFGDRSDILRMTSDEAVSGFRERQLDFVYIDAQHHYEAVREDIAIWYPMVRTGGLFAGHDYFDGMLEGSEYGVKSAVDEFVAAHNVRLLTSKRDFPRSWFIFK